MGEENLRLDIANCPASRRGQRVRCFAKTLDRRTNIRLDRKIPPYFKRLRENYQVKRNHDPPRNDHSYVQTTRKKITFKRISIHVLSWLVRRKVIHPDLNSGQKKGRQFAYVFEPRQKTSLPRSLFRYGQSTY